MARVCDYRERDLPVTLEASVQGKHKQGRKKVETVGGVKIGSYKKTEENACDRALDGDSGAAWDLPSIRIHEEEDTPAHS